MTSRATKFMVAMKAIEAAVQAVGELEDGLFGFQLREVVAAKVSLRQAEERLVAVANLGAEVGS